MKQPTTARKGESWSPIMATKEFERLQWGKIVFVDLRYVLMHRRIEHDLSPVVVITGMVRHKCRSLSTSENINFVIGTADMMSTRVEIFVTDFGFASSLFMERVFDCGTLLHLPFQLTCNLVATEAHTGHWWIQDLGLVFGTGWVRGGGLCPPSWRVKN